MKEVVIVEAKRTPIGSFMGSLSSLSGPQLAATCIQDIMSSTTLDPKKIDECFMGCVLSGGVGQAPARQAALFAGLPQSVCCTTVNRVCGSGLKTVMFATQAIQTGDAQCLLAGGMESMSQAPYFLDKARTGYRMGHGELKDMMVTDGLWDVYNDFHMGKAADMCATEKSITREQQDEYATASYTRAQEAMKAGLFKDEITAVTIKDRKKGEMTVDQDEEPDKVKFDKMGALRPAFGKEGSVTAANASSLSDGASVLMVCSQEFAAQNNLKPLVRIVGHTSHAQAPEWFTTAPVGAVKKLLDKTSHKVSDIDTFEINEAFSVMVLSCMQQLEIPHDRVNPRGGAVALGHPLGASAARILTTLIHNMKQNQLSKGIATMCIGGGEASAILVENVE